MNDKINYLMHAERFPKRDYLPLTRPQYQITKDEYNDIVEVLKEHDESLDELKISFDDIKLEKTTSRNGITLSLNEKSVLIPLYDESQPTNSGLVSKALYDKIKDAISQLSTVTTRVSTLSSNLLNTTNIAKSAYDMALNTFGYKIGVQIRGGRLYLNGDVQKAIDDGYELYLFRFCRMNARSQDKITELRSTMHRRKGWLRHGGDRVLKVTRQNTVYLVEHVIDILPKSLLLIPDNADYSHTAESFVYKNCSRISWGSRSVWYDGKPLRMPFAVAFGKKGEKVFTMSNLVSNMAKFHVVHQYNGFEECWEWSFGK